MTNAASVIGASAGHVACFTASRIIGAPANASRINTTGIASRGPNSSASGGVSTIAPPKPVTPRITPARPAIAIAASCATVGKDKLTARVRACDDQADRLMSAPAKRMRACEMSERVPR